METFTHNIPLHTLVYLTISLSRCLVTLKHHCFLLPGTPVLFCIYSIWHTPLSSVNDRSEYLSFIQLSSWALRALIKGLKTQLQSQVDSAGIRNHNCPISFSMPLPLSYLALDRVYNQNQWLMRWFLIIQYYNMEMRQTWKPLLGVGILHANACIFSLCIYFCFKALPVMYMIDTDKLQLGLQCCVSRLQPAFQWIAFYPIRSPQRRSFALTSWREALWERERKQDKAPHPKQTMQYTQKLSDSNQIEIIYYMLRKIPKYLTNTSYWNLREVRMHQYKHYVAVPVTVWLFCNSHL